MKVVAFYLPQYHTIPENDNWWGKGFTEWTNVKKAKKIFSWQSQPRIPLNKNYYNLDAEHERTMRWQIDLAKKHGIYGFCFYHYWFKDGKKLLEKPVEKFLNDTSLDINFCLSWANEPWTRTWDGGNKEVIMPQEYGNKKEWKEHYQYLRSFFLDKRYMRKDNMPIFVIYRPELISNLDEMLQYWQHLSKNDGFDGLYIISQGSVYGTTKKRSKMINTYILYEPGYTQAEYSVKRSNLLKKFIENPRLFLNIQWEKAKVLVSKIVKINIPELTTYIFDYDLFWKHIVTRRYIDNSIIPGAFCDWDNSPRRGSRGSRIFKGASPKKFEKYFELLVKKTKNETTQDMIFINAWNEWAEGTYLEPDNENECRYLQAVYNGLKKNDEFPLY